MLQNWNPIWVELRFMGRKSVFEFHETGRPLGIGSGLCTDLRINDAKVALVHCELMRASDSIWLVPAGSADVRLNAAHVGEACALPERSVIEFLDHEIEVVIHTRMPASSALRGHDPTLEEPAPMTLKYPQWLG